MTPEEVRTLLIESRFDPEKYKKLPNELVATWIMRPKETLEQAKKFRFLRWILIIAGCSYFLVTPYSYKIIYVFLAIAAYEVAYFSLLEEKCRNDDFHAFRNYIERVNQLIERHLT